jgi:hypothetical protein
MSTSSDAATGASTGANKLRLELSSIDDRVRDAIERVTVGKAGI